MSSEISTSLRGKVRSKPDVSRAARDAQPQPDHGLHSWQFFVLAALGCATAGTFAARGQGVAAIVLISALMGCAALVGIAALRTFRPLVSAEDDRVVMVGQRTRIALEREKLLTLKTIKELEFDRAMGKLSDADWQEMSTRLRARAARLMRQLDASAGFRDQIERDLAKRLGEGGARLKPSRYEDNDADTSRRSAKASAERDDDRSAKASAERDDDRSAKVSAERDDDRSAKASAERDDDRRAKASAERDDDRSAKASAERLCASCSTANDEDARFCKSCGQALAAAH